MVLHVSLGSEALAASLRADEGPLVGVDQHVDAQILLLAESPSAGGFRALEGLGPIVEVQVRLQADPPGEDFFAALVRAAKDQLAAVRVLIEALGVARGLVVVRLGLRGLQVIRTLHGADLLALGAFREVVLGLLLHQGPHFNQALSLGFALAEQQRLVGVWLHGANLGILDVDWGFLRLGHVGEISLDALE